MSSVESSYRTLGPRAPQVLSGRVADDFSAAGVGSWPTFAGVQTKPIALLKPLGQAVMPVDPAAYAAWQNPPAGDGPLTPGAKIGDIREVLYSPGEYPDPYVPGQFYPYGKAILMPHPGFQLQVGDDPTTSPAYNQPTLWYVNKSHTAGADWATERDAHSPPLWLQGHVYYGGIPQLPGGGNDIEICYPLSYWGKTAELVSFRDAGFPLASIPTPVVNPALTWIDTGIPGVTSIPPTGKPWLYVKFNGTAATANINDTVGNPAFGGGHSGWYAFDPVVNGYTTGDPVVGYERPLLDQFGASHLYMQPLHPSFFSNVSPSLWTVVRREMTVIV